jgi:hypothetical protein
MKLTSKKLALNTPIDFGGGGSTSTVAIVPSLFFAAYLSQAEVFNIPLYLLLLPFCIFVVSRHRFVFFSPLIGLSVAFLAIGIWRGALEEFHSQYPIKYLLKVLLDISGLLMMTCAMVSNSRAALRTISITLAVFTTVSGLISLALIAEPTLIELRRWTYPVDALNIASFEERNGINANVDHILAVGLTNGIVPFGYQLAMGFPFVWYEFQRSARGMVLASGLGLIVVFASIFLLGQRSAFLGIGLALATFFVIRSTLLLNVRTLLVVAVSVTALSVSISREFTNGDRGSFNLFSKQSSEMTRDTEFYGRANQQWWAVTQIPQYPLGTIGHDVKYAAIAPLVDGDSIAPHNGFISPILFFGWPMLAFVLVIVLIVGRSILNCRCRQALRNATINECYVTPFIGSLIAVACNGFFHNAGVLTFEPASVLAVFLVLLSTGVMARQLRTPR